MAIAIREPRLATFVLLLVTHGRLPYVESRKPFRSESEPVAIAQRELKLGQHASHQPTVGIPCQSQRPKHCHSLIICHRAPFTDPAVWFAGRVGAVPFSRLRADFDQLKRLRKTDPQAALRAVGAFGAGAVDILAEHTTLSPFAWRGLGSKQYAVAALPGSQVQFSRAINERLFLSDPAEFRQVWGRFEKALAGSAGSRRLTGIEDDLIDQAVYTAVVGYAAAVDLFNPGDRGGPGSFFEMITGPAISLLTGRAEGAAVTVPVRETGEIERITTDLSFVGADGEPVLVVPTKISTRERISQAYVHQRILDAVHEAGGPLYRSVLAIANENNTMFPPRTNRAEKTIAAGWTQETLVPGTIVLYHKYVAKLDGLYYLDPPHRYVTNPPASFPTVRPFSALLTQDLEVLLQS